MTSGTGRVCVYLCHSTPLIFLRYAKRKVYDYIVASPTAETISHFRIVKNVRRMGSINL